MNYFININNLKKLLNKIKKSNNKIVNTDNPYEIILNENNNTIFTILPKPNNNIKEKYRFTNISLYSLTPVDQSQYLISIIQTFFKNTEKYVITDANGCIGGNTWSFASIFKNVNVIELNKLHYDILIHNMKLLKINNINYYNGNILDYLFSIKQDIIFFDPPWGGVKYKNKKNIIKCGYSYYNQFIPIDIIVTDYNFCKKLKMIILKIPLYYNIDYMKINNKFKYYYNFIISNRIKKIYKIIIFTNIKQKQKIEQKYMSIFKFKNLKFHKK